MLWGWQTDVNKPVDIPLKSTAEANISHDAGAACRLNYSVFAYDPSEDQLSFLCSATSNTWARKHCDTVWRLSRVSLWQGNGAFKHREHKIILPCGQGRHLQRVRDVHNPTTERQNSIMSNLHRATWAVSAKTVKPLNSEAFDYCELCSVHVQQCCFSLAEYTAHTHTHSRT